MINTFSLECWNFGDSLTSTFSVEIDSDKRVRDLIPAIKEKRRNVLGDIDAVDVMLWKVSIPMNSDYWHEENIRKEISKVNPLASIERLSNIYPITPQDDHLHIVAWSSKLILNCWIVGQKINSGFTVTINNNQDVDGSKRAIKERRPNILGDIDAVDVMLWKASIPMRSDYWHDEHMRKEINKAEPLTFTERLSSIHSLPPLRNQIHIVVSYPRKVSQLVCWIVDSKGHMFSITVDNNSLVGDLPKLLKKSHVPANIEPYEVGIWRASIPVDSPDIEQRAQEIVQEKEQLSDGLKWSDIFVLPPENRHIHVVVWYPKEKILSRGILRSPIDFLNARTREAPSSAANTGAENITKLRNRQENHKLAILNGRPRAAEGKIPITLLHPIFARFTEDCESIIPTAEDNELALELLNTMPNLFPYESDRISAICEVFGKFELTIKRDGIPNTRYELDGCLTGANKSFYLLMEGKNEMNTTKSEPYFELCFYYVEANREYFEKNFESNSRRPCLLMIITGSHLSFSGAVWQDQPVIEPLTEAFPLHCHMTNVKMRSAFCRAISATRKALPILKACYDESGSGLDDDLSPRWFPYPNKFTSLENSEFYINYNIPTEGEGETFEWLKKKLIFFATIRNTGRKVCIKFTHRYSREVHEACANMRIAPKLLGYELLPGGWIMVVMDKIDGDYTSLSAATITMRGHLYNLIKKKLEALHQSGMVHGDIRDANIMVQKAANDNFMLLDFDWAGKIGEVRYPMNVNRTDLWRPDDAIDGELIKADHDMMMLDDMFGRGHQ